MNNYTIKEVEKSGILITKEKLIEVIRKANLQTFMYSTSPGSKQAVVVIPFN